MLNVFGSRLNDVPVPIARVSNVEHKKGWFGDKLSIRFKSLSDAEAIPGARQGQVVLKIRKKERDRLRTMVVDVELALAQHRLDELESA